MYRNVLTVLKDPAPLRRAAAPYPLFTEWSEEHHNSIKDLKDTFSVLEGYGLAAPQIGISKRAIIISLRSLRIDTDSATEKLVMINPELELSAEQQRNLESCFSVPHISAQVSRALHCTVKYTTESGVKEELKVSGFAAACLQHEVDHLDGKLYIDRVGRAWRSMLLKKSRKIEKKKVADRISMREEFEKEHRELDGVEKKKVTHSRKRKPKARKKRPKRSKKR